MKVALKSAVAALTAAVCAYGRPNVIFILTDDMGWGDLGCFHQNGIAGPKRHFTPHLDQLAADGVQLRQHYCGAPVCAPSRASFLLGVHQGHANVRDNQFDKALENNHTVATVLKQAGYATAMIGKHGLQGSGASPAEWAAYPTKRGFDYYYGCVRHADGHQHYPANSYPAGDSPAHRSPKQVWENDSEVSAGLDKCYTTDLFTARAKQWIIDHRNASPVKPFFLYLAYDTPHAALQLPAQAYPDGGGVSGGVRWIGTVSNMINTASGAIDSWIHPDYASNGWTQAEMRFATSVRRIDSCVGDLRQTLADLNIASNTLVVFSSDNGPHSESYLSGISYNPASFESFGIFDGIKRDTWEGGIRVPTLAVWPAAIPAGATNSTPSQFHDWMPTFADAADIAPPARTDGVSLLPMLTGLGAQRPPLTYIEYASLNSSTPTYTQFDPSHRGRTRNQMQVVFEDGYKGVRYDIQSHDDDFEIYDLKTDPQETNNLASALTELQQRMKDRVLQVRTVDSAAARPYDSAQVPSAGAGGTNGLHYAVYEGTWPWVPDFTELAPVVSGSATGIDLSVRTRDDNIGIVYSGYIAVPESGAYSFHLSSDSGALLRIHDAVIVDNDFTHDGTEKSGSINLRKGLHPIRISYAHTNGAHALDLQCSRALSAKQPVPATAFFLNATGKVAEVDGRYIWGGAGTVAAPAEWDDAALNSDPSRWGRDSAPDLTADTVLIPSGGIQKTSGNFDLSSTGSVTVAGGYLSLNGISANDAASLLRVDGGQVRGQYIKPMAGGTIQIAKGYLELYGANEPLATASTGYLDFTGDSGVFALPFKSSAYLADRMAAGRVRITGQTVGGFGPAHAVNGRYFINGVETSLVLVKKGSFQERVFSADNPAMYLMFNENIGAGHAVDGSGHASHASDSQGAVFGAAGLIDGAASFDGSSWMVTELTLNPDTNLTVEVVVKFNAFNTQQDMVSQKDGTGTGRSIFYLGADGFMRSYLGGKTTLSALRLEPGRWYHLVLQVEENGSSDRISFYANGEADLNAGTANVENNDGKWVAGSHKNNGSAFVNGVIDEIAVYDRLLSEEEILFRFRGTPLYRPGVTILVK
jgi:arylsulfatase A-like enzyme